MTPPVHLVPGDRRHGVARYAAELASECGAEVADDPGSLPSGRPAHLHLTDRLVAATPDAAATAVERLARRVPLTLTLHDVPQPTDGPVFPARAAAYARMVRAARRWATNSEHERTLVRRWCSASADGAAIALPVPRWEPWRATPCIPVDPEPVLGVFGFVYPGKGHRQVVRAAAALRRTGVPARVLVAGGAAPGHDDEVVDVVALGRARGVPVEVTGHLAEHEVPEVLRAVAVPVVAHRNVSASGSLNTWLAAGRRPLVRDGAYAREVGALRPGTVRLFTDATLTDVTAAALRRPASTWLPGPDGAVDLRPHLADTARTYRAWWAS